MNSGEVSSAELDMRLALNSQIVSLSTSNHQYQEPQQPVADAKAKTKSAKSSVAEFASAGPGQTFQEHWPSHLPRPPSMKKLVDEGDDDPKSANIPRVIVFNGNTQEGASLVRVLSEKGLKVTAVVRVFTSLKAKQLTKLKGVQVKVADLNDMEAVKLAAEGCQQAFLVTKYWERFENPIEETMAKVVLDASSQVGIKRLVLATFEDTQELRRKGRKSQLTPTADGLIYPKFEGMESIDVMSKGLGIELTHMMTSYFDEAGSKKSLILVRGPNGKIVSQSHIQDT